MARRPLIAGNWKMNGLNSLGRPIGQYYCRRGQFAGGCRRSGLPAVYPSGGLCGAGAGLAGHYRRAGLSRQSVRCAYRRHCGRDACRCGASAVIVGHSERRSDHHELTPKFAQRRWPRGGPTYPHRLCRGNPRRARCRKAREVVGATARGFATRRRDDFVVAYEPVWAIGTGLTPTAKDVADMHGFIRERACRAFRQCQRRGSGSCMAVR